jgi:hypothetical protein
MKKLFDIECYPNFFCLAVEDYDNPDDKKFFEISQFKNDLEELFIYLKYLDNNKCFMIGFNSIHYDCPVLNYIFLNYSIFQGETGLFISGKIKEVSDHIIGTEFWWNDPVWKQYKYRQNWIDVDLFLYWSKMLRQAKRISLKSLGIQLGYHTVQELPYPPNQWLKEEEIKEVSHYNSVHDISLLRLVLDAPTRWQGKKTTMYKQVGLRSNIKKTYGLPCMSWDAPKIGSEILLKYYCDKTNNNPYEVKKSRFSAGTPLELDNPNFKTKIFQDLYNDFTIATRDFKRKIPYIQNNTRVKLSYGIGGIHSENFNEIYESNKDELVVTSDVASLYPNLIINYKLIRYPIVLKRYTEIKDERIIAKRERNHNKNVTYKLVLNSVSGLLDNKYSWLYYPEGAMKMRIMGQLIMSKAIEEVALAGFRVVSANTDGIEVIVPKSKLEEYYTIVDTVGTQFNLDFEHEIYKKIVYKSVNEYIAITQSGSIKVKGSAFITEPNLGDSCNHLIIPKALQAYFKDGIKPKTFITKSDHNILDFCLSKKVDKSYKVKHKGQFLPQRLNRFFVSKNGGYLYKHRKNKDTHMLKGWGVEIYNNHNISSEETISDKNIDYTFYISETNKLISELETPNYIQQTLF